jgi:hypothetical protein
MPPMLIMNTRNAWVVKRDSIGEMVNILRKNGNYVLRGYGSARWSGKSFNYHAASNETLALLEQFIADLRNLRQKNKGIMPAYKNWYKVFNKYYPSKDFYNKWKKLP